jgi:C-terminal processing protease CtpA/Prc
MYLDPGPGMDDPFASNAAGLVFRASEGDAEAFTVAHVVRNSPAADAAVQIGDVVLAVNSRTAASFTLESLTKAMQGTGECCLRLRREDASREVCFELRPPI